MKKIAKISLVAALAIAGLSSNLYAADSIKEAFSNAKVKGDVKTYYFAQDVKNETAASQDSTIWVNGGSLNFVTDSFNGLVFGSTFQTSHVADIDDKGTKSKTNATMNASGSVLSESYLAYSIDNTTIKAGRQFISTPLLAGSSSRMIKESFEAALIVNTDLPQTTIIAGKISKYQGRTDSSSAYPFTSGDSSAHGGTGIFTSIGEDGLYTIYIVNNSIDNLKVRAQYASVDKLADLIYVDAKYNMGAAYIATQYYGTSYDSKLIASALTLATPITLKDSSLFGLKIGAKLAGVDIFAGYTSTSDGIVQRGLGQGAYAQYTASTKTAGATAFSADTDSFQVGAGYTFGSLKTKVRYSSYDVTAGTSDLDEITINLEYKFTKELKAQIDYSILDYENDANDATDLRTRLIYSF